MTKQSDGKKGPIQNLRSRDTSKATATKICNADEYALSLLNRIERYQSQGINSLGKIAEKLADEEVEKRRGGFQWRRSDVKRLLDRLEKISPGFRKNGHGTLSKFFFND
ncbi:MAG: hypothetical protein GYB18_02020 [Oceanospirillales bacterium]|nr:hypothetical protein [Oceanospirillales bacterium]